MWLCPESLPAGVIGSARAGGWGDCCTLARLLCTEDRADRLCLEFVVDVESLRNRIGDADRLA